MIRHTVSDDPLDALRMAWAKHIGVQPDGERVYGWEAGFDYFAAGWLAHEAAFQPPPPVHPDKRHQTD